MGYEDSISFLDHELGVLQVIVFLDEDDMGMVFEFPEERTLENAYEIEGQVLMGGYK